MNELEVKIAERLVGLGVPVRGFSVFYDEPSSSDAVWVLFGLPETETGTWLADLTDRYSAAVNDALRGLVGFVAFEFRTISEASRALREEHERWRSLPVSNAFTNE